MYWCFLEQDHVLIAKWKCLVYIVNKASPTVYQLEILKKEYWRSMEKVVSFLPVKGLEG